MTETKVVEGLECFREWVVREDHVAGHLKERGILVLSTPGLLLMFEVTARECVDSRLPGDKLTVGTLALIRHYAPAPVGSRVAVKVRVESFDGRRASIYGEARAGGRLVGEVYHERRVVSLDEYLERVRGR